QCYSSCVPSITSRQNPIVARFRAVAKGERADLLLLDGVHLITEAIGADVPISEAAVMDCRPDVVDLTRRLHELGIPVTAVSQSVMDALSPVRSASPVVALAERPAIDGARVYREDPFAVIAMD